MENTREVGGETEPRRLGRKRSAAASLLPRYLKWRGHASKTRSQRVEMEQRPKVPPAR